MLTMQIPLVEYFGLIDFYFLNSAISYARDIDWDNLTPLPDCKKKYLFERLISILGDGHLHQVQRQNPRHDAIFFFYK